MFISDYTPLIVSLKTAITATVITFILGLTAAKFMYELRSPSKPLIEAILISPLILPPTVLGFLLLLFLGKTGPLNPIFNLFNIRIIFTWIATVITATIVSFPLMYKTTLTAFEQIDINLINAGRTLGASEINIFWKIILPLAYPGILTATLLSFLRALGEFGATLMLAGNIPGQTQTIPLAIYFAMESGAENQALFWVLLLLGISLFSLIIIQLAARKSLPAKIFKNSNSEPLESFVEQKSGLYVEIEKHLPAFSLQIEMTANKETLGILGASGAGKSMLLKCIAGLETPHQGKISLNGNIFYDSQQQINLPPHRRNVGIVFQNYALFPHLTVAQNIGFGLDKLPINHRQKQIREKINQMQLQGLENRYPHQLSGGQKQRVALARALAPQPAILLLDEPFSALDTYLRHQLEKQLRETLKNYQGITLFVTHNLEEAYRLCKNLMVIEQGKVAQIDTKENILKHPVNYDVALLTGCKNFSQIKPHAPNIIEALDWQCLLQINYPLLPQHSLIAIRAHHLIITEQKQGENSFPCWLTQNSETPFRNTLYLKLHSPPQHPQDYHLQAEIFKEKWEQIKDKPTPWYIQLNPNQLMLISE